MKPKVPITLVIADTGPLISLAVVDRLDLLQSFGSPVFVTDAVMYECTRLEDRPGAARLREWFEKSGENQHRIIKTPFGPAYLEAMELERQGHSGAAKNFGEWATSWSMDNIDALLKHMKLHPGRHFGLILAEDKAYLNGVEPHDKVPSNAHFLSTRAFFSALALMGFIPSASDLVHEVKAKGRPSFAKNTIDRPVKTEDFETDYMVNLRNMRERQRRERVERTRDVDGGSPMKPR